MRVPGPCDQEPAMGVMAGPFVFRHQDNAMLLATRACRDGPLPGIKRFYTALANITRRSRLFAIRNWQNQARTNKFPFSCHRIIASLPAAVVRPPTQTG